MKSKFLWISICAFGMWFCIVHSPHPRTSFPGIAHHGYPFTWMSVYRPCWGEDGPPTHYSLSVLFLYVGVWNAVFLGAPRLWASRGKVVAALRKKKLPQIVILPAGFRANDTMVEWSQIASIKAFKLDLITSDLICLAVEVDGNDRYIQLSEEWPGFKELAEKMEARFAFPEGWWDSVAKPAFKTNEALLYQRTSPIQEN